MSQTKTKVGIIGCGNISGAYLGQCPQFDILEVAACADLLPERAQAKADEFHITALSVEQMLADPEIAIIINLTIPKVHAQVSLAAIAAGKSVWSEKPLAINREDARKVLDAAKAKGVLVGCAPDTVLGGGHQTCRKLIDDGWIGAPVAGTAFMLGGGPESWHPDPEFLYQVGGGPLFDMGPYYLTALTTLLGPVRRVSGTARITFAERMIGSEPKRGTIMQVEVPTHIAAVLDFASGPVVTLTTSFDMPDGYQCGIEIYGTEGMLKAPDPNAPGGPVLVKRKGDEWREMPLTHGYTNLSRSIGVADMAYALRSGRPHRASGDLAYHVLDIMHAVHDASCEGKYMELASTITRPAPLPMGLRAGTLDEGLVTTAV